MRRVLAVLAVPLLAAACATQRAAPSARLESPAPALRECAEWYRELDARIDAAGVRDAQARRLDGFPYLRVNRLLAALAPGAAAAAPERRALVDRMQALDTQARGFELANLGDAEPRRDLARAQACGARLRDADMADPRVRAKLIERARVEDDYSTVARVLGLYALTKYPFFSGVRQYHADVRAAFRRGADARVEGALQRYAPPDFAPFPRAAQAQAIARASANALGIPEPGGEVLDRLLEAHAPVFEVQETGDYDRPGALRWRTGESVPAVDPSALVVYRHAAWTRYRGQVLLQLVYTIWFPERPSSSAFDLLSGKLDGVTWRVTLAPDGTPLVYDTMHPCGCFHMFFPTPRARPVDAPESGLEWMFSPLSLPEVQESERPVVRLATRTHYVEGVSFARATGAAARYVLRDYDELRSLPRPGDGRASVFGPDGLIAGTERFERFFFWPMGVPSAGAMRQWGHHATAFVGRRHFEDADLLEKRFVLQLR